MIDSDIRKGLYVSVDGHLGIVREVNAPSLTMSGVGHGVQFTADDGVSTVTWWCRAIELEPVRGV